MLSKVVEIISDLVMEVRIKVNEFGLSITAIVPANVAMIGFKLPKSAFSQFEVGTEVLGVSLDSLKKILKRCGSKSSLILEKKDNQLEINIYDKIKSQSSQDYNTVSASVDVIEPMGNVVHAHLKLGGKSIISKFASDANLSVNQKMKVVFDMNKSCIFSKRGSEGEKNLFYNLRKDN